jgi:hypothetical protein
VSFCWSSYSFSLNSSVHQILLGVVLSTELKSRLAIVAKENFDLEQQQLEENIPRIKDLLLKLAHLKKLDIVVLMEGTKPLELNRDERDLVALEKANLIKGTTRYTDHNMYRRYELTEEGEEVAKQIAAEENAVKAE